MVWMIAFGLFILVLLVFGVAAKTVPKPVKEAGTSQSSAEAHQEFAQKLNIAFAQFWSDNEHKK